MQFRAKPLLSKNFDDPDAIDDDGIDRDLEDALTLVPRQRRPLSPRPVLDPRTAKVLASKAWKDLGTSAKALGLTLWVLIPPEGAALIGRHTLRDHFGLPLAGNTYARARRELLEARIFDGDAQGWWSRPSTDELLRRLAA